MLCSRGALAALLVKTRCLHRRGAVVRKKFVNAGAGGDGNGDVEAPGRFKGGGEGVAGSTDGRMEAVRSTCSAWGLIAFLSGREKMREKR